MDIEKRSQPRASLGKEQSKVKVFERMTRAVENLLHRLSRAGQPPNMSRVHCPLLTADLLPDYKLSGSKLQKAKVASPDPASWRCLADGAFAPAPDAARTAPRTVPFSLTAYGCCAILLHEVWTKAGIEPKLPPKTDCYRDRIAAGKASRNWWVRLDLYRFKTRADAITGAPRVLGHLWAHCAELAPSSYSGQAIGDNCWYPVDTDGKGVAVDRGGPDAVREDTPFGPRERSETSRTLFVVQGSDLFTLSIRGPLVEVAFIESTALGVVDRLKDPPSS